MRKSFFKSNDYFFLGISVVALSVFLFAAACRIKIDEASAVPKIVIAFMGAMGLCMIFESIVKYRKGLDISLKVTAGDLFGGIILPGSLLVATCLLLEVLGFYISAFLLVISVFILQSRISNGRNDFSLRRIIFVALFALGTSLFMYLIFRILFGLQTPKGIFGF